jgi:hypothetical protein
MTCPSGFLGTDCKCYNSVSNSDSNSENLTENAPFNNEDASNMGKIGLFLAKIAKIVIKIF